MRVKKALVALAAALLLFGAASAAAQRRPGSINGRVLLPDGRPLTHPVKISVRQQMHGDRMGFYTDNEGQFRVSSIDVGVYTIEAEDDRERQYDNGTESIEVFPDSPTLVTVYLKDKSKTFNEKSSSNTISAAELDEHAPAAAVKEFERGTKAGKEGKYDEAVEHMRKALSVYPNYLKARNDLGTFLLAQGKVDEAANELAAAVKIAPKAFNPRLNLGIVLVRRHEFADAAEHLEVALSLDPDAPAPHLYAGLAHLGLGDAARAEKELATAYKLGGSEYAIAQFHLGQLYMDRGDRVRARAAFETYLRDKPDARNADEVRRMIAILR